MHKYDVHEAIHKIWKFVASGVQALGRANMVIQLDIN